MKKNIAVKLQNISKIYKLYDKPIDRLKESIHPFKKKYHKDFYALKDINLEIKKGEVLGIVGVNGAGKSTLLKIISGVIKPTAGRVNIHGKVNAILELGAGLKPEMTGRQNIKLSLQINGIENNRENITQEIIDFSDIGEYIDQPIKIYSTGMKARLGFAIATSTDPDILIVDEVLAVGDVLFQRKCYRKINKLFKDGKTVIFVSHSTQSIIEFCSRAVLLYDREVILDSHPKKVTDFYQKLVFSKVHSKVLDEIKGKVKMGSVSIEDGFKKEKETNKIYKKNINKFVEGLKVNPKVLNNSKIKVQKICIVDGNNLIINQLETNKYYKIYIKACINKCYNDITFGIAISNVKGQSLSCTREYLEKRILIKDEGNNLEFFWNFKCNFLDGKYFIKIDFREGKENLLYQSTDSTMFEVNNTELNRHQMKSCLIDLEQTLEIIE